MAKVKLGSNITDIRNSVGGHVFLKGRGGAVVRTSVAQQRTRTFFRAYMGSFFAITSQTWRTLTAGQRNAWNNAVEQWLSTDIFGDSIRPSGSNLFNRLNWWLSFEGLSMLTIPPLPVKLPVFNTVSFVISATTSSLVITTTFTGTTANTTVAAFATYGFSKGVSIPPDKFCYTGGGNFFGTSANLYATYLLGHATPLVGSRVFIKLVVISTLTGQVSAPVYASAIVT